MFWKKKNIKPISEEFLVAKDTVETMAIVKLELTHKEMLAKDNEKINNFNKMHTMNNSIVTFMSSNFTATSYKKDISLPRVYLIDEDDELYKDCYRYWFYIDNFLSHSILNQRKS